MVRHVDDLGPGQDRGAHAPDVVAVGVAAMIVEHQSRESRTDGLHQLGEALGSPQAGVILDGNDHVGTRDRKDLLDLVHIIPVGVLRAGGEADAGHQQPPGPLHLFEDRDQVGHMVEKIIDPPNVHVARKLPDHQADDLFRIMAIAEEASPPHHCLQQGPGHGLADDALD